MALEGTVGEPRAAGRIDCCKPTAAIANVYSMACRIDPYIVGVSTECDLSER